MQSQIIQNRYLAGLVIFLVSFSIYVPSLSNGFVWDDTIEMEKNHFKLERVGLLRSIFPDKREVKRTGYYRPVSYITLAYDYKIWGLDNPHGFHLANLIFNSATSILAYFLFLLVLKRFEIEGRKIIAFTASMIFIVHPMHVESVSWIAGRTDILCSLFFIGAFITHLKSYENRYLIIPTCVLFYASLLSKELALAFPFAVIACDFLAERKIKRESLLRFLIYLVFIGIYLYLRTRGGTSVAADISSEVTSGAKQVTSGSGFEFVKYLVLIKTLFVTYLFYFYKLLVPFWFSSFISNVPKGSIYLVLSLISFLAIGYAFFSSYIRSGFKGFCILWLLLVLGPSSIVAVVQIASTPLAERYLYLPLAPFSLLVAFALYRLNQGEYRRLSVILFGLIIVVLSVSTITRQSVWKDRVTFWKDASRDTSDSIPLINYGMALIDSDQLDKGARVLRAALKADKNASSMMKSIALNNLGIAYMKQKKFKRAHRAFQEAVKEDRRFHKSYYHLGLIYHSGAKMTTPERSKEMLRWSGRYFLKSIEAKGNYSKGYLGAARVYFELGDLKNAKKYAKTALRYGLAAPDDQQAKQIINHK